MSNNIDHRIELRPHQLLPHLQKMITIQRPFLLHGSPGNAKSSLIQLLTKANKLELIDMRLSQYEFIDLRGIPTIIDGKTHWNPPDILPNDDSPPGILFLDELGHAEKSTQSGAFQLILDRRLGGYKLPDHWSICAATNYLTDNAMVEKMSTALKNRMTHFYIISDVEDWAPWAINEGNVHEAVIGYLRFQPSMLQAFQNTSAEEDLTFLRNTDAINTPRTWEWASDLLKAYGVENVDQWFAPVAGTIGMPAATGLRGFVKYYSQLPDLDDLIANPNKYQVPDNQQTKYALVTGLSARINADNFDNVMKFVNKMDPEFRAALIIDAIRRDDGLTDEPAFAQWVAENSQYIF